MRSTRGFLTSDDRFFSSRQAAAFHEAQLVVSHTVQGTYDAKDLIDIIKAYPNEILTCAQTYLAYAKGADKGPNTVSKSPTSKPNPNSHPPDYPNGEGQSKAVEQLTRHGPESMPHIRARARREALLLDRPGDGPRSRKPNARGVLGRANLATDGETKA